MRVLSLFDGISCLRVALEREKIPIEVYYSSEIDKYAISVSRKNWPDIIQLGDVRSITKSTVGDIDLIVAGFPCQDLSIAKKDRKGLDGERSGLFWELVRIHNEVKPRWWIYENVASMAKDQKQIISDTLGVEPILINAALVSAQNRRRLFWTNIPNIQQPEDKGILLKDILESGEPDRLKSYCIDANYYKGTNWEQYKKKGRRQLVVDENGDEKQKSNTVRTSGLGSGVDDKHNWQEIRLKSYAIPATYYKENVKSLRKRKKTGLTVRVGQIGKGGQGDRIYSPEGKSVNLSANGGGRGAKTGLYLVKAAAQRGRNIVDGKRKDILGAKTQQRIEIGGDKANTITKVQKDSLVAVNEVVRKLTAVECERLTTLHDNFTAIGINEKGEEVPISRTQRYKMCGNAFVPDVIAHILSFIPK